VEFSIEAPEAPAFSQFAIDDIEFATPRVGGPVTYVIDPSLTPSQTELVGLDGGPPRPIAVVVGSGGRDEFVVNEVTFHPNDEADLNAFLAQYGGTVLRDGTPRSIPGFPTGGNPRSSGWYLIRVDLQRSALDDLSANLEAAGMSGQVRFSSEDAARLAALVAREMPRHAVSANPLGYPDTSAEHPDGSGGNIDAETWPWMTEDDDPLTSGDQGLSVGVTHAWRYLQYMGLPPSEGTWTPIYVAVIDSGFDLDPVTGIPLNGNTDFSNSSSAPLQEDMLEPDRRAGGEGQNGGWHGQGAFGVCCAYPANGFGSAGIGGQIVRPILMRVDLDFYTWSDAFHSAVFSGADVITLSMSGPCEFWCSFDPPLIGLETATEDLSWASRFATGGNTIVLTSASNQAEDLDTTERIPCEVFTIICVGAVYSGLNPVGGGGLPGDAVDDPSWGSNWGSNVAIWAPTYVWSTVSPDSAASDCDPGEPCDNVGDDELEFFSGTSAATPFAAGVVALMKALEPTLAWTTARNILQETSNPSGDLKVDPGYVDAYRAVARVMPNGLPTVVISNPAPGNRTYRAYGFLAEWQDPEPGGMLPLFTLDRTAAFSSDRDGALCTATASYTGDTTLSCDVAAPLTLGQHEITAVGTDPFGAQDTDSVTINVVNEPPIVNITAPIPAATFRDNQAIRVSASVVDPDGGDIEVTWSSSLDGPLTTGTALNTQLPPLSQGNQVLTVTAEDERGVTMQDSIPVVIEPANGFPSASIVSHPTGMLTIAPGTPIPLQGVGIDPEEGPLTGANLEWSSDVDGDLGTGSSIEVVLSGPEDPCGGGPSDVSVDHIVTLLARDRDGHETTDQIRVSVGFIC
jgi:hypothetical protein